MKKQILFLFALCVATEAGAQSADRQVLGSGGTSYSGSALQADNTVGQVATATGTAGTYIISQGFQQNESNSTGIKEQMISVDYALYPNPASDEVTLSLNTQQAFGLKLSLTDLTGAVLFSDTQEEKVVQGYQRIIRLSGLASGIYFLNLFTGNSLNQSIRFVKQ